MMVLHGAGEALNIFVVQIHVSDIFVLLLQGAMALIPKPNLDLFHRASLMQMFLKEVPK